MCLRNGEENGAVLGLGATFEDAEALAAIKSGGCDDFEQVRFVTPDEARIRTALYLQRDCRYATKARNCSVSTCSATMVISGAC